MKTVATNQKYVVLYGDNLTRIQKYNPGITFSGAKKIRKAPDETLENLL